ncbi:hypothetical protein K438DRAFT_1777241 [Mycena galopus ATCC 62051]|nr:hypothetical protein K438DRAFT_1777241 [Mycena galopus ATCC 62051]
MIVYVANLPFQFEHSTPAKRGAVYDDVRGSRVGTGPNVIDTTSSSQNTIQLDETDAAQKTSEVASFSWSAFSPKVPGVLGVVRNFLTKLSKSVVSRFGRQVVADGEAAPQLPLKSTPLPIINVSVVHASDATVIRLAIGRRVQARLGLGPRPNESK